MPVVKSIPVGRPWSLWTAFGLLIFLAFFAMPPGWAMISDPSGAALGMSTDWLQSPFFSTYLIPGLFLFIVIGAGSLFVAVMLLLRPQWRWAQAINPFHRMEWVWSAGVAIGVAVMVWIAVQVLSVTLYSWLQPAIFAIGAAVTLLMFEPRMRRYFAISPQSSRPAPPPSPTRPTPA